MRGEKSTLLTRLAQRDARPTYLYPIHTALLKSTITPIMLAPLKEQNHPGSVKAYYQAKIEAAELLTNTKTQNLRRLEAQRNALNARGVCRPLYEWTWFLVLILFCFIVRLLREELQLLHDPGSYVGEVVKVMGKSKVLVKVQPEGKYSSYFSYLSPIILSNNFAL